MGGSTARPKDLREHWESIYSKRAPDEVSWFEPTPGT
jgi:hypothetical protein